MCNSTIQNTYPNIHGWHLVFAIPQVSCACLQSSPQVRTHTSGPISATLAPTFLSPMQCTGVLSNTHGLYPSPAPRKYTFGCAARARRFRYSITQVKPWQGSMTTHLARKHRGFALSGASCRLVPEFRIGNEVHPLVAYAFGCIEPFSVEVWRSTHDVVVFAGGIC